MERSCFEIGLGEIHGGCFEIEAIDNDQISTGEKLAIRRNGLESMRIDPFRDDAGQLNSVTADVFHDARDRCDGGDDAEFLLRRGVRLLFLASTGSKKKCGGQNNRPCCDGCKFHLVKGACFFFSSRRKLPNVTKA